MDEFCTAKEVVAFLQIPLSPAFKLDQDKTLSGFKVGKLRLFRRQGISG